MTQPSLTYDRDDHIAIVTFNRPVKLDGLQMPTTTPDLTASVDYNFRVILKIWKLRIPSVAPVNGYAVAAGSNIAMIGDITLASDRARLAEAAGSTISSCGWATTARSTRSIPSMTRCARSGRTPRCSTSQGQWSLPL